MRHRLERLLEQERRGSMFLVNGSDVRALHLFAGRGEIKHCHYDHNHGQQERDRSETSARRDKHGGLDAARKAAKVPHMARPHT